MTHLYAYIKEGYSGEQIRAAIQGMKQAVSDGFGIVPEASTVAVKEVPAYCASSNLDVLILVYTAKNKGIGQKKQFAKLLDGSIRSALPECKEVRMIIKEQAADMSGYNGMLRSEDLEAMSRYEIGK